MKTWLLILLALIAVGCGSGSDSATASPTPEKSKSAFRAEPVEKMLDHYARFYRQMETGLDDFDEKTTDLYEEAHKVLDPIEPKTEEEKVWKEDFLDYAESFDKYKHLRAIANASDSTKAELHKDYSFKSTGELMDSVKKKKELFTELRGMWEKL